MKKHILFLAFFGFSVYSASAQIDTEERLPLFRVSEVSILPGGQFYSPINATREDFQTLAPQSQLLQNDMAGYNQSTYNFDGGLAQLNLLVGLQIADREEGRYRTSTRLRLGVTYDYANIISNSYWREDRRPYDTLVSSRTGQEFMVDSVTDYHYNMNYQQERIGLHASMIWQTNPANRWSLYGGVGAAVNFSFNAYTTIRYSETDRVDPGQELYEMYEDNYRYNEGVSEEFQNQTSFGGSIFVPMGADMRLGREDNLWRHLHIFAEARPGLGFVNVPELSTYTRSYLYMSLGLKYSLDRI